MTALATSSMSLPAGSRPVPLTFIQELFESFGAQLGSKVAEFYGNSQPDVVQREWACGLAGFRRRELERGIAAVRSRRFVPTLGEFVQLCRPALDPEYAWHEAVDGLHARDCGEVGAWSHPAVYRAARVMQHELRTMSFPGVRKRWERILEREFASGWGEEVPAPAPRIEHKPTLRAIPSDVKSKLAELSRGLKG